MSALSFDHLDVWFELPDGGEFHAVRDLSLDIAPGERIGLIGESGSGKTTSILAAMGLLPPTAIVSGHIWHDGEDVLAISEKRRRQIRWRHIGMVFQGSMSALNPVKTIGEQMIEPMALHRTTPKPERRDRAAWLLERVGLTAAHLKRYPHELSGGMRQRVCIAMALACRPRILLADEPTTALDVLMQAEVLELLAGLTDELGLALILVTHDLGVVAQLCERTVVMYGGAVMEDAPTERLIDTPVHPYSSILLRATPDLFDETPAEARPRIHSLEVGDTAGCPFRPRCPEAMDICGTRPGMRVAGEHRRAACHLVPEDAPTVVEEAS
jgi:oligopeptide/dipeptide ABC transporter ATP-binding protein